MCMYIEQELRHRLIIFEHEENNNYLVLNSVLLLQSRKTYIAIYIIQLAVSIIAKADK